MHRIKAHLKESPAVKSHPQRIIAGFRQHFHANEFLSKTMILFLAGHRRVLFSVFSALAALCILTSCSRPPANRVQGYVEGEFVYVASPYAGSVKSLNVQRGDHVKISDLLFTLDSEPEKSARDEAEHRLMQSRSSLEDARKSKRPTEIESAEAQLRQARAALTFSEKEFARQEELLQTSASSIQDVDRARSTRDQDRQRVSQLEADLLTAHLGSRTDQIAVAAANMKALESALTRAEWDLSQKRQSAPEAGLIFDTLYREGEWAAAGHPVVVLLPPRNIKVRAFVPENLVGSIHSGDTVRVTLDGTSSPIIGKVSFISPQAEYTPPVIYSRESRGKLVFMIEAVFDPKTSASLHPGQPVDVQLGP
jgi:HlyD family secretion protein